MNDILNWQYLWGNVSGEFQTGYFLLVFFLLTLFLPNFIKNTAGKNKYLKKSLKKKLWPQFVFGITGIFLILSRLAGEPDNFFAKRFWLYLLLVLWILTSTYLTTKIAFEYRKRKKSAERERNKQD